MAEPGVFSELSPELSKLHRLVSGGRGESEDPQHASAAWLLGAPQGICLVFL